MFWTGLIWALLLAVTFVQSASETKERRKRQYPGGYGPGPLPMGGPPLGGVPFGGGGVVAIEEPALSVVSESFTVGVGACPGGQSLGIPCDVKRPWPACPPQSYCYASNSADIGPYYCCPIWSTYGAQWRPRAPFYPYYPPMPYNWPPAIQATAGWPSALAPAVAGGPMVGPIGGPYGAWGGPFALTNKLQRRHLQKKKEA